MTNVNATRFAFEYRNVLSMFINIDNMTRRLNNDTGTPASSLIPELWS